MKNIYGLLLMASLALPVQLSGQPRAINDSICVNINDVLNFDLSLNDIMPSGPITLQDPIGCFMTDVYHLVWAYSPTQCPCGEYTLRYSYDDNSQVMATIQITIKCDNEKPECFLTDLAAIDQSSGQTDCLYACENQNSTYFVPHVLGNIYNWTVVGAASFTTNVDGNELYVNWGPSGLGTILLTVTNGGANVFYNFCVEILDGPLADFDPLNDCACLNSPISFLNNSIGANSYFWEFGDGNTSTQTNPTHSYSSPGTYTVILYAYTNNVNDKGDPLCCCTDTTMREIIIEDLEGPPIYWISTLCPGDKSFYWTDADGCTSYDWTVLDHLGAALPFTGDGSDSICVTWGDGPYGTVSLSVTGCNTPYCEKPATAYIPIISDTSSVTGPDEVCSFATENYSLPKWLSVYYDWTVTGGIIISGNGTNAVMIQWGAGPTGTIHVEYQSEFLNGLPIHNSTSCIGFADLVVSILPAFQVTGPIPAIACVGDMSSLSSTSIPSSNYSWSVSPYAPFTGDGTANITVTWSTGPGTYVIQAITNSPLDYCNDTVLTFMTVIELATPDSIVGPDEICPNETSTYLGYSSTPNTSLEWTVTGGTPTSFTGSPITVTWNPAGPYSISLAQQQINPPNCLSDTITKVISPIEIQGPISFPTLTACINSQSIYSASPVQHPDAVLEWKIDPVTSGSVTGGQGTLSPTIQWNNDPGSVMLSLCVTLCDITVTETATFPLLAPLAPTITQIGELCPGVSAVLDATSGFSSYLWTGPVIATTEDITITSGGTYVLTTIDGNGCQAITTIMVNEIPGPVASISSPHDPSLCLPAIGQFVTMTAITHPNYEFTWYCDGVVVQGPSMAPTYTHNGTNDDSSYLYCAVIRDVVTGCLDKSNVFVVSQDTCTGSGGGCMAQNYTFSISALNPAPDCNTANFTALATPNVTITSWDFGDPSNNTNDGTLSAASHVYSKARYYTATAYGSVPNVNPPPANCVVSAQASVCIPLATDFTYTDSCLAVCFDDGTTFLPGHGILTYYWEFGDGSISIDSDPCYSYPSPGAYNVTLTVTNSNGCVASHTESVTLAGFPTPTLSISPDTLCVGEAASFSGSGAGILTWLWDFDDGATNGAQNADHSYALAGVYDVSLTVSNADGCTNTVSAPVVVYPNPLNDTISHDSSLLICEGEQVMLYAPVGAYSYLWNTGDLTSFLLVGVAGDYSVKVTDANGCMMETPTVTVVVVPLPEAEISGPAYICDAGCITLSVTTGAGYTYQWLDFSSTPIGAATNPTHDVCDNLSLPTSFYVEVTDANDCMALAGPYSVDLAISPVFVISVVGDLCEGTPNILSVPILPDVRYQWSTGASGTTITTLQAGSYTVIGTDTLTNCSHTESVIVNPLPDLCIVPTGCYEICNPDTLCGPDGLTAYQWNMNGIAISGATNPCLIVMSSGSYSLTGTNEFNCTLTSDTLILNVIECTDCTDQEVTSKLASATECCYTLSFNNTISNAYGLLMHTADADIDPDLSTLDPSLAVFTIGSNYIGLVNSSSGSPLPAGNLFNYLDFCLRDITNLPQVVIFDWYNDSLDIVCSDTLIFDCPIDSDCIFIASDSIYCVDDQVTYVFTICNSSTNVFPIEYLIFNPSSPLGISLSPSGIDLSGSPLAPGSCQTFSILLNGTHIANELFCYTLIGHASDPTIDPGARCCALDTARYIHIPGCTPCDQVYIEAMELSEDSCCYSLDLINNFDPTTFDGIGVCVISSGLTFTLDNPFGSTWNTDSYTPTNAMLSWQGATPFLPLGVFEFPNICIEAADGAYHKIEIKWMSRSMIICRDTLDLFCEPDCGYIVSDSLHCQENGNWIFEGYIKNTSSVVMHEAFVSFHDPALVGYNQTILLGSLAPGVTFGPFFILLGAPALPGQTICTTIILHELDHDSDHIYCCSFDYCFTLPDCGQGSPCICNGHFETEVEKGFSCVIAAGFIGTFVPLGELLPCDEVIWLWGDGTPNESTVGNVAIAHAFSAPGEYNVCFTVHRFDDNGKVCEAKYCKEVTVKQVSPLVYPNPSINRISIDWPELHSHNMDISIYSLDNKRVASWSEYNSSLNQSHYLLDDVAAGVYLLIMENENHRWVQRLVVF